MFALKLLFLAVPVFTLTVQRKDGDSRSKLAVDATAVEDPKATQVGDIYAGEISGQDMKAQLLRDWPVSVMTYPPKDGKKDSDDTISKALQAHGAWEPEAVTMLCDAYKKHGAKGNLLDVGANIGSITLPLASCLNQNSANNGVLIAVEASPANQKMLRAGIKYNSLSNIHLYEYAVSVPTAPDTLLIGEDQHNHGNSKITRFDGETQGEGANANTEQIHASETKVTTLDSIAKVEGDQMKRVFAMKMDIEGHEAFALEGAEDFLTNGPCMIFIEMAGAPAKRKLSQLLGDKGYVLKSEEKGTGGMDGWFERTDMESCVANL